MDSEKMATSPVTSETCPVKGITLAFANPGYTPGYAMAYAAAGLRTVPLALDTKIPVVAGYTQETFRHDPAQVRGQALGDVMRDYRYRDGKAGRGIGIVTGRYEGVETPVWVLDIDARHGGLDALIALEKEHGVLPVGARVCTPSGGFHYYWRLPEGVEIRNSASVIGSGIDVRGQGGQAAAPGTVREDGRAYCWPVVPSVEQRPTIEIPEAPAWLLQMAIDACPPKGVRMRIHAARSQTTLAGLGDLEERLLRWSAGVCKRMAEAQDGQWNNTLNAQAYSLAQRCAYYEVPAAVSDRMRADLATAAAPRTTEDERLMDKAIDSGWSSGLLAPAPLPDTHTTVEGGWRDDVPPIEEEAPAARVRSAEDLHQVKSAQGTRSRVLPCGGASHVAEAYRDLHPNLTLANDMESKDCLGFFAEDNVIDVPHIRSVAGELQQLGRDSMWMTREVKKGEESLKPIQIDPTFADKIIQGVVSDLVLSEQRSRTVLPSAPGIPTTAGLVQPDGTLRPIERADRIERRTVCRVAYREGATAPRWLRFLDEVFASAAPAEREGYIKMLQEFTGACLAGVAACDDGKLLLLVGDGNNGKSVFLTTIAALFCPETITGIEPQRAGEEEQAILLHGARININSDLSSKAFKDTGVFKAAITGQEIRGRHLFHESVAVQPVAGWIAGLNALPDSYDGTDGFWRRVRVIPFRESFTGREDRGLTAALAAEREGILQWAVEGLRRFAAAGRRYTAICSAALQEWRASSSPVMSYVSARVTADPAGKVTGEMLYLDYTSWCARNGIDLVMSRDKLCKGLPKEVKDTQRLAAVPGHASRQRVYAIRLGDTDGPPPHSDDDAPPDVRYKAPSDPDLIFDTRPTQPSAPAQASVAKVAPLTPPPAPAPAVAAAVAEPVWRVEEQLSLYPAAGAEKRSTQTSPEAQKASTTSGPLPSHNTKPPASSTRPSAASGPRPAHTSPPPRPVSARMEADFTWVDDGLDASGRQVRPVSRGR